MRAYRSGVALKNAAASCGAGITASRLLAFAVICVPREPDTRRPRSFREVVRTTQPAVNVAANVIGRNPRNLSLIAGFPERVGP